MDRTIHPLAPRRCHERHVDDTRCAGETIALPTARFRTGLESRCGGRPARKRGRLSMEFAGTRNAGAG